MLGRRAKKSTSRIGFNAWRRVEQLLREEWRPEQISGWKAALNRFMIEFEDRMI